ncbi:uncharacterized protein LOC143428253 [Xylocopa sonorina]|uniref:uncharacterized protein LOC143428253 n=1 Tax=Xylocopa sonorina TaxID=1818115 RepID=UPI00403AD225
MRFLRVTLSVLLLNLMAGLGLSDYGFDSDYELGVCDKLVRYTETRYVPYQETYRANKWRIFYETKVRWNYKKEYYVNYRREKACCVGYKLSTDGTTCNPDCDPPCANGRCIKPNYCQCSDGYRKNLTYPHNCEPVCYNCDTGRCVEPGVCQCHSGYQMNKEGICKPVCTLDCEQGHAFCSAPNECTCHENYEPVADYVSSQREFKSDRFLHFSQMCRPICQVECVNAECTAPNVCTCHRGYEPDPDNMFRCVPKCDDGCPFGTCTAPNVCTCDPGYRAIEKNKCEPICDKPCVMASCIAPNLCSCNEGYGFLGDSNYVCEPICEKACINGTCTAPDVCTCHDGYKFNGDDTMTHVCEPFCETSCEPYGQCTAPNVCTCIDGYKLVEGNRHTVTTTIIYS